MYKTASKHPQPRRESSLHDKPTRRAVIAFRRAKANNGTEVIYRHVYPYRQRASALKRMATVKGEWIVLIDLHSGSVDLATGDHPELPGQWAMDATGVNKGADPYLAARYSTRERPASRRKQIKDEGDWNVEGRR